MNLVTDFRKLEWGWNGGFSEVYAGLFYYPENTLKINGMIDIVKEIRANPMASIIILMVLSEYNVPERKFICNYITDIFDVQRKCLEIEKEIKTKLKNYVYERLNQIIDIEHLQFYVDKEINSLKIDYNESTISFLSQMLGVEIFGSDSLKNGKSDGNEVQGAVDLLTNQWVELLIEEEKGIDIDSEAIYQGEHENVVLQDENEKAEKQKVDKKANEKEKKFKAYKKKKVEEIKGSDNKYKLTVNYGQEIEKISKELEESNYEAVLNVWQHNAEDVYEGKQHPNYKQDVEKIVDYAFYKPLLDDCTYKEFINVRKPSESKINDEINKLNNR